MSEQTESANSRTVRFVVLEHADRSGVHFDLMIDTGELLATWKCSEPPERAAAADLACVRLKNHRRRYLDYEGPLSDARGHVRRHDQGVCRIDRQDPRRWELAFSGQSLVGRFALEPVAALGDEWRLRSRPS